MIRNFEEVPFEDIAWTDASSRTTMRRVPPLLRLSVREVGVLNPLIVAETQAADRYAIVTGWLRFQAARETGEKSVPCHIYRSFPPKILLLVSLFDNLGHRHMNVVEQAIALKKLGEYYTPAEIKRSFLPMLGIHSRREGFEPMLGLADLPEDLQWAVAEGELDASAAQELLAVPHGHRQHILRLFRSVRMSDPAQHESAEGFRLLLEKKKLSPLEVMEDENWIEEGAHAIDPDTKVEQDLLQLEVGLAAVPTLFGARRELNGKVPASGKGNVLAPGEKARSSSATRKLAAPPKKRSAGQINESDVLAALERRLGKIKRTAKQDARLPSGARLCPNVAPASTARLRLEVDFNSPSELCGKLKQLLDAEERGALQAMLSRQ